MESNISEAITNNVTGTRNVADLAAEVGVEHLVLISTDKAVRPTSIMGATKRVAEEIVQEVAETSGRNFVAVRFGNVLGSRGSVVPMFLRQIRSGGPVTVTHPDMRRYFMTIPEAVQLVLQAGASGKGGEVFVLNMGEPVRILDLATDLIRLSGLEVGTDIEIRFTGTRPGEKLYEELFFTSENALPTSHPKVLRAKNGVLPIGLSTVVDLLTEGARNGWSDEQLRTLLLRLVPDFQEASEAAVAEVDVETAGA
jgi:FlaA1/EpsC-like NDP-sugar epimerase